MGHLRAHTAGLALGITFALILFIFSVAAALFSYGAGFVELLGDVYVGFSTAPAGILIGMLWAFVDGYLLGFLFVWIFNILKR